MVGARAVAYPFGESTPVQDQQLARQWSVREMGNEAPETLRASSEPAEKNVFQEFDKHLLIVSEAAAALTDHKTSLEAHNRCNFSKDTRICDSLSERTVGLA
jgi:hypothetical protein